MPCSVTSIFFTNSGNGGFSIAVLLVETRPPNSVISAVVPTGWGPRGLMLRIGTQSVSPFSAPRTAIGPHCDDGEGNRSVCFSCGAARSARHGAREAVVATAGGLSQDGRRRRSPGGDG